MTTTGSAIAGALFAGAAIEALAKADSIISVAALSETGRSDAVRLSIGADTARRGVEAAIVGAGVEGFGAVDKAGVDCGVRFAVASTSCTDVDTSAVSRGRPVAAGARLVASPAPPADAAVGIASAEALLVIAPQANNRKTAVRNTPPTPRALTSLAAGRETRGATGEDSVVFIGLLSLTASVMASLGGILRGGP